MALQICSYNFGKIGIKSNIIAIGKLLDINLRCLALSLANLGSQSEAFLSMKLISIREKIEFCLEQKHELDPNRR